MASCTAWRSARMPRGRSGRNFNGEPVSHVGEKCATARSVLTARSWFFLHAHDVEPQDASRRRLRMTLKRKPVAFGDMRGWIKALEAAGELRRIGAEVDWNIELGT